MRKQTRYVTAVHHKNRKLMAIQVAVISCCLVVGMGYDYLAGWSGMPTGPASTGWWKLVCGGGATGCDELGGHQQMSLSQVEVEERGQYIPPRRRRERFVTGRVTMRSSSTYCTQRLQVTAPRAVVVFPRPATCRPQRVTRPSSWTTPVQKWILPGFVLTRTSVSGLEL